MPSESNNQKNEPDSQKSIGRKRHKGRIILLSVLLLLVLALVPEIIGELDSSNLQSRYLSNFAKELTYKVEPGPNPKLLFPQYGPFDQRNGFTLLPKFVERLQSLGYQVAAQARHSDKLERLIERGMFAVYQEKTQAGLSIADANGDRLYSARYPQRIYHSFEEIPELVLRSVLFVEDRDLLDMHQPYRNPALDWDRLVRAVFEKLVSMVKTAHNVPGGSTLATQLEKYRHSPGGLTSTGKEKLRQMFSASARAYLAGRDTSNSRKKIALDYVNSIPLAALPGWGEVNGLGDGLWAWYGQEFEQVNKLLAGRKSVQIEEKARVYKYVLSLFISHRRPALYLVKGGKELRRLTDSYLRLLAKQGIIDADLRDAALKIDLPIKRASTQQKPVSFLAHKGADTVRTKLLELLGIAKLYVLDRFDLLVKSNLNQRVQKSVTEQLLKLRDREYLKSAGLTAERLLQTSADPKNVIYSVTVYERTEHANLLRVQTDNFDQPFNINRGVKLDLGSTAKLRTLVHYLEIIEEIFVKYKALSPQELKKERQVKLDALSNWVLGFINADAKATSKMILEAAMQRTYSASTGEVFFTGGGEHTFVNFDKTDNDKVLVVSEALRKSVNLVFIRMMRDIAQYHMRKDPQRRAILDSGTNPVRRRLLEAFVESEANVFLRGFWKNYKDKKLEEVLKRLLRARPNNTRYLALAVQFILPNATPEKLLQVARLVGSQATQQELDLAFGKAAAENWSLSDRGYALRIHPLELWLASFLIKNPTATRVDMTEMGKESKLEAYRWLLSAKRSTAQDVRIRIQAEREAFKEIHKAWKRLGYPFNSLVPSYATSIGSSGDRPAALAELMGIIINGGMRLATSEITELHFASATPFETVFSEKIKAGERVLSAELVEVVRRGLIDVVEHGTAQRVKGAFKDSTGKIFEIGGKTGTGDHRFERIGAGGKILGSRVVNRTATFVFLIGDRFFGTVVAYVHGPKAAEYKFTSALPAQLLKILAPSLMPLFEDSNSLAKAGNAAEI